MASLVSVSRLATHTGLEREYTMTDFLQKTSNEHDMVYATNSIGKVSFCVIITSTRTRA